MEYFNAIPPVALALLPIIALGLLGAFLNFTSSIDLGGVVCRLKQYTVLQHTIAATGSICVGIIIYFLTSHLFDTFLVPILKKL